ncbi:MAG: cytochrome c peroxidase, partial [Myxococcota bacterium]
DLSAQAMGPVLNPVEMAMPSEEAVVQRLRADERYRTSFEALFGNTIFEEPARAYRAMAEAIAAFEASDTVSPFDSRYDRSLEDSVQNPLSLKEALGKSLFFSQTDTNCATCHQLRRNSSATETFTSGEYHNIGVPPNIAVRTANGLGPDHIDHGLMAVTDNVADDGKFKVPTLRNIAVTGPYMHNGVFAELRTVVLFYDQRFEAISHPINPETGEPWADPEVATTINHDELGDGGPLTDTQIEALVCFMRTLTDARFESLIPEDGITCTDP